MSKKILKTALFSSLTFLSLNGVAPIFASASESLTPTWIANSPEAILIKEGQKSYTLVLGDTLWAISQKTNITVETLANINNIDLSKGEQYFLPVGRVIHFDGNKVVVTEPNGNVVSETIINDEQKVNPDQNVGEIVKPSSPSLNGNNNSSENSGNETPVTPSNPSEGGAEGQTPVEPSNPSDNGGNGGETPVEPSNPGDNGNGGETPTDPSNPGECGNTEEPGNGGEEPGEKVYAGEYIDGVNNGDVGTWTDKNAMMDYIENNWDAVSGGRDDYSMTTNGYGWIAMFY
ncbi:LysM peptidoglycan-binding domain-containing protein [Enterococcus faecalis]|nr:LysM peptidoglycan-binding domain-containing protein [Enterococcus faecalis]